jgi:threonine dehydrogenase-like Zn-dependent dehydrogenase
MAGVCATDLEIGRGYMDFTGVPGHEFVGIVESSSTDGLAGSRVVGEINCACGECELCRRGEPRHCSARTVLGISGRDGCFAEYICLPDRNLHVLPGSLTDFEGVMVEPTAAAYRVVEQLGAIAGTSVAVLGDGRLGLLVAQALAGEGADVRLVGKHPERAGMVSAHGVDFVQSGSAGERSLAASLPLVIECTGSFEGPAAAMKLLRPLGTLVLKTTVGRPLELPSDKLVVDEIKILGSRCGPFEKAIDALANKKVQVEAMLHGRFTLDSAADALKHAAMPGTLKTIITMM